MNDDLLHARESRRDRFSERDAMYSDDVLDYVGLSEDGIDLGVANVSPHARKKLKGIIDALRKDPHPFTRCMKNLREEQPGWSEDRRKKTCNVLKALAGRQGGNAKAGVGGTSLSEACMLVDDDVAALLDQIDSSLFNELASGDNFAFAPPMKLKSGGTPGFVFAGKNRYPIHTIKLAKQSITRAMGKPEEAAVKKAAYAKFPELRPKGAK